MKKTGIKSLLILSTLFLAAANCGAMQRPNNTPMYAICDQLRGIVANQTETGARQARPLLIQLLQLDETAFLHYVQMLLPLLDRFPAEWEPDEQNPQLPQPTEHTRRAPPAARHRPPAPPIIRPNRVNTETPAAATPAPQQAAPVLAPAAHQPSVTIPQEHRPAAHPAARRPEQPVAAQPAANATASNRTHNETQQLRARLAAQQQQLEALGERIRQLANARAAQSHNTNAELQARDNRIAELQSQLNRRNGQRNGRNQEQEEAERNADRRALQTQENRIAELELQLSQWAQNNGRQQLEREHQLLGLLTQQPHTEAEAQHITAQYTETLQTLGFNAQPLFEQIGASLQQNNLEEAFQLIQNSLHGIHDPALRFFVQNHPGIQGIMMHLGELAQEEQTQEQQNRRAPQQAANHPGPAPTAANHTQPPQQPIQPAHAASPALSDSEIDDYEEEMLTAAGPEENHTLRHRNVAINMPPNDEISDGTRTPNNLEAETPPAQQPTLFGRVTGAVGSAIQTGWTGFSKWWNANGDDEE